MKAAILRELNHPLHIESLKIPKLEYGQVLVKLFYSGVCHSQVMEARGRRGVDKWLPHLLGHEGTAEVIEIGSGVTKVKSGDKVILGWIKSEGIESVTPNYLDTCGIKINAGAITTFNEYAIVSENRLVKLPEGVPLDVGVLFGCAIPTGAGMVINEVKPEENSIVAIFGLGGIGLSALMALNLYNCKQVIAIDIEEEKLELAKEFGATDIVNVAKQNPIEEIMHLTNNNGVDYAIEATGMAEMIEKAFKSVRRNGGLCIFASHPKNGDYIKIDPYDLICGKQIRGSWGGSSKPDKDIPKLAELYLQGKLPLEKLLGKRYSLEQINQALDDLENRKTIRPIIKLCEERE